MQRSGGCTAQANTHFGRRFGLEQFGIACSAERTERRCNSAPAAGGEAPVPSSASGSAARVRGRSPPRIEDLRKDQGGQRSTCDENDVVDAKGVDARELGPLQRALGHIGVPGSGRLATGGKPTRPVTAPARGNCSDSERLRSGIGAVPVRSTVSPRDWHKLHSAATPEVWEELALWPMGIRIIHPD